MGTQGVKLSRATRESGQRVFLGHSVEGATYYVFMVAVNPHLYFKYYVEQTVATNMVAMANTWMEVVHVTTNK